MVKKVTWLQTEVSKLGLAFWLTDHNFQPGKFVVLNHPFNPDVAIVVYES